LYPSNIEDGTIVDGRIAGFGGHDHAEERVSGFKATTKHEAISRFENMEDGRETWETELTYKDGGV
jgi:hypothetical protein